jgi:hypothetical protein
MGPHIDEGFRKHDNAMSYSGFVIMADKVWRQRQVYETIKVATPHRCQIPEILMIAIAYLQEPSGKLFSV